MSTSTAGSSRHWPACRSTATNRNRARPWLALGRPVPSRARGGSRRQIRTWAASGSATRASGTRVFQLCRAAITASCQRRCTASAAAGPDLVAGRVGSIHTHQCWSRGHPRGVVASRWA